MAKFVIEAQAEFGSDDRFFFVYDNIEGTLTKANKAYGERAGDVMGEIKGFSPETGLKKSASVRKLKIQLGLSCNYECGYCSQRFVPRADETSVKHIDSFIEKLGHLDLSGLQKIEFWGGEPFVYWKTFQPLAERLREQFPNTLFTVITNGSLLDLAKIQWLDRLNFSFAISHDGPAQHFRGPDPLDDPEMRKLWRHIWERFGKQGRFSFNAMLHGKGASRAEIRKFFVDLTGDESVVIGEGGIIDAYDDDGIDMSLQTKADHFNFRRQAFVDMLNEGSMGFNILNSKINGFINGVFNHRSADTIGQKCGMDEADTIAVDLMGNVITCQNTSAVSVAGNGQPHLSGSITDIESVNITTSTHWSERPMCSTCPVLQLCQGNCMYLSGDNWDVSCANQYSDNIATFAFAFFGITQMMPVEIKPLGFDLPLDRRDIWGEVYKHEEKPRRRVIPIKESKSA